MTCFVEFGNDLEEIFPHTGHDLVWIDFFKIFQSGKNVLSNFDTLGVILTEEVGCSFHGEIDDFCDTDTEQRKIIDEFEGLVGKVFSLVIVA